MPNIINMFPLSVYREAMPIDPAYQAQLVQAVLEMAAGSDRRTSAKWAWTGDVSGYEFLHNDELFAPLFAQFAPHLRAYLEMLSVRPEKLNLYYTRSWATVSRGQEAIKSHRHVQSHISVVYYIKKPPESGAIRFNNHDRANEFAPQLFEEPMFKAGVVNTVLETNTNAVFVDAREGDILIFPSKTSHATTESKAAEPRISIAIDILTTLKDSARLEHLLPNPKQWKAI